MDAIEFVERNCRFFDEQPEPADNKSQSLESFDHDGYHSETSKEQDKEALEPLEFAKQHIARI